MGTLGRIGAFFEGLSASHSSPILYPSMWVHNQTKEPQVIPRRNYWFGPKLDTLTAITPLSRSTMTLQEGPIPMACYWSVVGLAYQVWHRWIRNWSDMLCGNSPKSALIERQLQFHMKMLMHNCLYNICIYVDIHIWGLNMSFCNWYMHICSQKACFNFK